MIISVERSVVVVKAAVHGRESFTVDLEDGRTVTAPLAWFPRLMNATDEERQNFEVSANGIHWPDLDEDVSIEGLLRGKPSGESQKSLSKWLESRENKGAGPKRVLDLQTGSQGN